MKNKRVLLHLLLVVGLTAFALPGSPIGEASSVDERYEVLEAQSPLSLSAETSIPPHSSRQQDDYYDRRRRYWEDRLERELDDEEFGDDEEDEDDPAYANEQTKDKTDTKETKKGSSSDSDPEMERELEQRREYWSRRLDRDW
jgi:hypothetical protein